MQKRRQKYNKGSNHLPTEEYGNANARHFGRAVARVSFLDVKIEEVGVTVRHHDQSVLPFLEDLAEGFGMVQDYSDSVIVVYRHHTRVKDE